MAILSSHLKVTIRGTVAAQQWENVQWYKPTGAAFVTAEAAGVAQAYWDDVKTAWRALIVTSSVFTFQSVLVSEPGDTGAFGEYPIPISEQNGTRAIGDLADFMPPFNAWGMRLTVATRTTRPGQKRFCGIMEGDANADILTAPGIALLEDLAPKFSDNIVLGSPVATGVLIPEVVRIDRVTGDITASQEVTGFLINPYVTSQVSRKRGRGA